jgi:hypothetical protein
MIALVLAGALAAQQTAAAQAQPAAAQPPSGGRLVVLVVIDQLRYQDLLWLAPALGPKGFGGVGRPAPMRYDTVVTETAADHAVLSTGAYADLNGIIGNRFYTDNQRHEAVEDPACPVWGAKDLGRSAANLRVPTVGDAFKLGTNGAGRVFTVAVKDRSALFLGGTSADLALWLEAATGQMTSTTCYAKDPPAWLADLWRAHPISEWKDWSWTPLDPAAVARYAPQVETPGAVSEVGPRFPHQVGHGKVDKDLVVKLKSLPAGTTIALQAARALVENLRLGDSGSTDLLGLAVSAVDGVGHQFGTTAPERVDAILRTNQEVTAFLDFLRARLGSRLAIVLTADHGVTPIAADERRLRAPGGTVDLDALTRRLNDALERALGPRPDGWVLAIDGSAVSLRQPYPPKALQVAAEVLRRETGLWKVVLPDELARELPAIRHAVFPGRSGEILLVPRPLWTLKKPKDGADHGSPWNDDALVPLLVQAPGWKLRPDVRVLDAAQVAPTVAALLETAPPAAALADPAVLRDE